MTENNIRGRFIVFEGIDGSGKSTQIDLLCARLRAEGRKVHKTSEPTALTTGGLIRDALAGNRARTPEELAALFLADRIAHNVDRNDGIIKCLENGTDVICDRYYYSSFAYQGMDSDLSWVMTMNLDCRFITKPDLCLFMDVSPSVCKNRVDKSRVSLEIFEYEEDTLSRVRNKYLEVFSALLDHNIKTFVNEGDPAAIAEGIYAEVSRLK